MKFTFEYWERYKNTFVIYAVDEDEAKATMDMLIATDGLPEKLEFADSKYEIVEME